MTEHARKALGGMSDSFLLSPQEVEALTGAVRARSQLAAGRPRLSRRGGQDGKGQGIEGRRRGRMMPSAMRRKSRPSRTWPRCTRRQADASPRKRQTGLPGYCQKDRNGRLYMLHPAGRKDDGLRLRRVTYDDLDALAAWRVTWAKPRARGRPLDRYWTRFWRALASG